MIEKTESSEKDSNIGITNKKYFSQKKRHAEFMNMNKILLINKKNTIRKLKNPQYA